MCVCMNLASIHITTFIHAYISYLITYLCMYTFEHSLAMYLCMYLYLLYLRIYITFMEHISLLDRYTFTVRRLLGAKSTDTNTYISYIHLRIVVLLSIGTAARPAEFSSGPSEPPLHRGRDTFTRTRQP